MEKVIQLVINDEIQAVKKLKTEDASLTDVLLFLASVEATLERLMDIYVEKIGMKDILKDIEVESLDEISKRTSRLIGNILKGVELNKKEKEAMKLLLKTYVTKELLKKMGVDVYYKKVVDALRKGLKKR